MFCLPPSLTSVFKEKLKAGEIDPGTLSNMSSKERHSFFKDFLGEENAKQVNTLFESKLLLKNQQRGMITWAETVAGLKPEVKRDIVSRVNKMTEVLNPESEQAFLQDLAAHKLGVTVSMGEAGKISELAQNVSEAKAKMTAGGDRLDYGRARVQFANYINDLKYQAGKKTIGQALKNPVELATQTAGVSKSLKASLDDSAIFRQGWKTLWTNPTIWAKNAAGTFRDVARSVGGKAVMDEVNADIVSRPNFDKYQKAKLDVGTVEESYPNKLPEKVPVLGRLYKASQDAFTGFVHKTRADVFDKYIDIAEKSGVDTANPKELQSIGHMVNALTGRGDLGKAEPAANIVNNVFFSPRLLKSHIDVLTAHQFQKDVTPFVRKQAAINLVKIITGTAAVLATAKGIDKNSVDFDPRSADFGKIKVGDTRFDVSGGMSSVITLAARLLTNSSKSSTTGVVKKLNTGEFGSQTGKDVVYNFLENKLSPVASVVRDILKGQDFNGNKPTVAGEAANLFVPLPIVTYQELKNNPRSAPLLAAMIADGLGIGTNTYSPANNWSQNPGKELQQFKDKVGEKEFKQANKDFNNKLDDWLQEMTDNETYRNLPEEEKAKLITKKKDEFKTDVFKQYQFKPKKAKPTKLPKL